MNLMFCNRSFNGKTAGTHNHTQTPAKQGRRGQARQTHEVFRPDPTDPPSEPKQARGFSLQTSQSTLQITLQNFRNRRAFQ